MRMNAESLTVYRAGFRQRLVREQLRLAQRREAAWGAARRAAEVLRARYGAERIFVFGSLARGHDFGEHSDVDLLACGVRQGQEFAAIAEMAAIDDGVAVNLVIEEMARPEVIERAHLEGVGL
jgi:predicted nucleotidyltransferase